MHKIVALYKYNYENSTIYFILCAVFLVPTEANHLVHWKSAQ